MKKPATLNPESLQVAFVRLPAMSVMEIFARRARAPLEIRSVDEMAKYERELDCRILITITP